MLEQMTVRRVAGDRYRVSVRGHELTADQPVSAGGSDLGATPTEMFVASLAACVAFYAGRALGRDATAQPIAVDCSWQLSASPPWRVTAIHVSVDAPPGTPAARIAAIERAVAHCTVHNTLADPPQVTIEVAQGAGAAA